MNAAPDEAKRAVAAHAAGSRRVLRHPAAATILSLRKSVDLSLVNNSLSTTGGNAKSSRETTVWGIVNALMIHGARAEPLRCHAHTHTSCLVPPSQSGNVPGQRQTVE